MAARLRGVGYVLYLCVLHALSVRCRVPYYGRGRRDLGTGSPFVACLWWRGVGVKVSVSVTQFGDRDPGFTPSKNRNKWKIVKTCDAFRLAPRGAGRAAVCGMFRSIVRVFDFIWILETKLACGDTAYRSRPRTSREGAPYQQRSLLDLYT